MALSGITNSTIPVYRPVGARPSAEIGSNPVDKNRFSRLIGDAIQKVNEEQQQTDQKMEDFAQGKTDNIHEIVINMEKADISFRMLKVTSEKAIDAYREIMRMNV
jgi:flagellar hook-basal body complex protein FliE